MAMAIVTIVEEEAISWIMERRFDFIRVLATQRIGMITMRIDATTLTTTVEEEVVVVI